jgi:hypothetical protein
MTNLVCHSERSEESCLYWFVILSEAKNIALSIAKGLAPKFQGEILQSFLLQDDKTGDPSVACSLRMTNKAIPQDDELILSF